MSPGMCHGKPLYINGGRVWVWPHIQQVQRISLNTMTLEVVSPRVYTKLGVPISVTGIAQVLLLLASLTKTTMMMKGMMMGLQVRIQGKNQEMLAAACQQFLGKSEHEIMEVALETLEGHQRAIMGVMTVEVNLPHLPFVGRPDEEA